MTAHSPVPRSKDFQGVQPNACKYETHKQHKGQSWNRGAAVPRGSWYLRERQLGTGNEEKMGHKNTPETVHVTADHTGQSDANPTAKPGTKRREAGAAGARPERCAEGRAPCLLVARGWLPASTV